MKNTRMLENVHRISIMPDVTERKQHERELAAIATVSAALRAARTRADMLPVIVSFARSLLSADGVALALRRPSGDGAVITLAQGAWATATGTRLSPDEGVVGHVMATGQPYLSDDVHNDPHLVPGDMGNDVHAVASVPLIAGQEILGALAVGRRANGHSPAAPALTDGDLRLLMTVGDIAAIALYRAGVLETLEQRVADRTRELAEANERLKELDRLKSKFVSNVSHELRTPVANLNLYLNLLERGRPDKRDHYLTVLKEQTARLSTLIEDILDLARLERDKTTTVFAPVDLNALVEGVIVAHQPQAEGADLALTCQPAPGLPSVHGDRNRLTQVVTNLVANALNYTLAGAVQVSTRMDEARQMACLEVRDTGIGIEPEDVPHLFDRFYRGKRVSQSDIPGTGLGLAIVKEIVDLDGGEIAVASRVGEGSTFTVWLPVEQSDAPASQPGGS